ncbi:hypothetical protein BH09SUM1_BH09SUM1_09360 [soil metagenome]
MGSTHTCILFHVVFATKKRVPLITPDIRNDLYSYMGGTIRKHGGKMIEIGGVADHVHIYLSWRADTALADLIREVKAGSSGWIHKKGVPKFAWQEGYGAFTIGKSAENRLIKYIRNQEVHHQKEDYRSEYVGLLKAYDLAFEEKYLE